VLRLVDYGLSASPQIKLSTKSFGTDAAEVAAKGIINIVATLEEADLSDVIAGLPRRQASQAQASGLICRMCGSIDTAARARRPRLYALILSSHTVLGGNCRMLGLCITEGDWLVANIGRPEDEALSALRIMAAALASHPKLRALDLSDNALGEKGIRAFAAGLTNKVSPLHRGRICPDSHPSACMTPADPLHGPLLCSNHINLSTHGYLS